MYIYYFDNENVCCKTWDKKNCAPYDGIDENVFCCRNLECKDNEIIYRDISFRYNICMDNNTDDPTNIGNFDVIIASGFLDSFKMNCSDSFEYTIVCDYLEDNDRYDMDTISKQRYNAVYKRDDKKGFSQIDNHIKKYENIFLDDVIILDVN